MSFQRRWLIEGILKVRTPLRIGSGGETFRSNLRNNENNPVAISAVAIDHQDRAYLPGSGLKGGIRSWAKRVELAGFETFFGSDRQKNERAGKLQFRNAYVVEEKIQFKHDAPPYWDATRRTDVTASVALDRRRRTASDRKLFHAEYIPPGVKFCLQITCNDSTGDEGCTLGEDGLIEILALLEGFNRPDGITLGAETADAGIWRWGRVDWTPTTIRAIDGAGLANWVRTGFEQSGDDILVRLENKERDRLRSRAVDRLGKMSAAFNSNSVNSVSVRLRFTENFIVNDPGRSGDADSGRPNHAPVCDAEGRPVLPRRSVKGAVRSHAERIVRTIGGQACNADDPKRRCKDVTSLEEAKKNLCLICKVFGAPGWRSPFQTTQFLGESASPITQEMLAIDRFTGGDPGGKKFNVSSFIRPKLTGDFSLDLNALNKINAVTSAIGLLALTFRDLLQGDIRFGFGAAKGFGAVRAELSDYDESAVILALKQITDTLAPGAEETSPTLEELLSTCVMELNEMIRKERSHAIP
jgi:CRISPR/Cas system CSM-associated protein Csm3 (group 7 of RAMP superfamily)